MHLMRCMAGKREGKEVQYQYHHNCQMYDYLNHQDSRNPATSCEIMTLACAKSRKFEAFNASNDSVTRRARRPSPAHRSPLPAGSSGELARNSIR